MAKNKKEIKININEENQEVSVEQNETEQNETPEQKTALDELEEELQDAKEQLQEQKDKYLRLFADFDNAKKRHAKERLEIMKTAGKDVIIDIVSVIDDVERAIESSKNATDVNSVVEGMELIKNKLFNTLKSRGLNPMDAVGKAFDSDFHEAITEIPAPNEDLKGKVVDVIEKGYTLNDKIIRYAKVVVGK